MYIDAGTGSLMLQAVAASVFAMVVFFKNIRSYFSRKASNVTLKNEGVEDGDERGKASIIS